MSTLDKAYLFIIHYTCFEISRVCAPIALCDWTKSGYVLLYFIVCMGFGCLCGLLLCQNYMISVHCKIWANKYHSKMYIDKRLVLLSCGHSTIIKRLISFYSNFITKFCLFWVFFILFFLFKFAIWLDNSVFLNGQSMKDFFFFWSLIESFRRYFYIQLTDHCLFV